MDNVYLENLNSNKKLEKVITVGTNIGAYPHSLETSRSSTISLISSTLPDPIKYFGLNL